MEATMLSWQLEQPCCSGRAGVHGVSSRAPARRRQQAAPRGTRLRCAAVQPGGSEPRFGGTVNGSSGSSTRQQHPAATSTAASTSSSSSSGGGSSSSTGLLQPQQQPTPSGPASSSDSTAAAAAAASSAPDYYRQAGQRLQGLLAGVGDGEEEFVNQIIQEQDPSQKIYLSALAGGVICAAAFGGCWLFGLDPLGGASLSVRSLEAAALGALASLPLVALKAYLWSDHAKRQAGWLEDWHSTQVECFRPLMHELNPLQTAAFMATEVVPGVLILLPAAMGGIEKALGLCGGLVGVETPAWAVQAGALVATAGIAGVTKLAENTMTFEEYDIIKTALENADRYYRVTAMSRDKGAVDARQAADAFKTVALTWMARSQLVSQLAAALAVLELAYLGVLWQGTGDLSAPMAAALAAAAVDFWYIRRLIAAPAERQARRRQPSV